MALVQDVSKTAAREIHHLLDQAQALVDATAGEQESRIKSARDALASRLESAKDAVSRAEGRFLEKVRATDAVIRERPYYAMGGACLAGLLFGWLLSRK
ncbi:hypothetical protein [Solidesulfovibrio sp.]|uniref:DUF883 family protein n=1 Tax=Solidesulfovibrio sp. TaxID=2910990 RepID=UPI00262C1497|nr:hypothetical protein [Solidesulfovibrio sp.]